MKKFTAERLESGWLVVYTYYDYGTPGLPVDDSGWVEKKHACTTRQEVAALFDEWMGK